MMKPKKATNMTIIVTTMCTMVLLLPLVASGCSQHCVEMEGYPGAWADYCCYECDDYNVNKPARQRCCRECCDSSPDCWEAWKWFVLALGFLAFVFLSTFMGVYLCIRSGCCCNNRQCCCEIEGSSSANDERGPSKYLPELMTEMHQQQQPECNQRS